MRLIWLEVAPSDIRTPISRVRLAVTFDWMP